jgi:prevent-host-death family protein
MKVASVSELKAELSRYLRMVRRGGEVQIVERGVPIARLVGLEKGSKVGSEAEAQRLQRLEKAGILRRGTADMSWLLAVPPIRAEARVGAALDEDREDRF